MNKIWFSILLLAALAVLGSTGCKHEIINSSTDNNTVIIPPGSSVVCFEADLLPLFQSTCALNTGCHKAGSSHGALDTYDNIFNYKHDGDKGIVPGNPGKSKIYEQVAKNEMPEGGPYWSQANKDLLKRWIEEGAKNTIGCASCDTSKFTYSAGVKPILDKNCVGCHQTATPSNRNVKLSDYNGVKATVTSGRLLPSINQTGPFPMPQPPSTKLNSCNLTVITKWVNAGAPNN